MKHVIEGYTVELTLTGWQQSLSGKLTQFATSFDKFQVGYKLSLPDGSILFDGSDYYPSPMMSDPEGYDSAIELLSFLTLRPGDTDSEYFDKYTSAQMEWVLSSECEQLGYFVSDYQESK